MKPDHEVGKIKKSKKEEEWKGAFVYGTMKNKD